MPVPSLVTDLSTTVASNSPAGSENVFPNLDDYIRTLAAFLASIRDNSGNGWVSPYLPLTYSAGTANGVAYLNGSKVVTTGSGLTFDGTNFATTGTASATKFIPTGGSATGNGMYLPAGNTLAFSTNGTEAARLDSSGNLGLGVVPSAWASVGNLQLQGNMAFSAGFNIASNAYFGSGSVFRYINTALATSYSQVSGQHIWYSAASGTAGNAVSFETNMVLNANGVISLQGTGSQANWRKYSTDNVPYYHAILKSRGTVSAPTTVALSDTIGQYQFFGYNGTNDQTAAAITGRVSPTGTVSATSMPGQLEFYTTPDGSNSSVNRLTIDQAGNVLVPSSGGLGYGTGSGGTVTQATSRTTGVTLNKTNGAITLVSAAGTATWQSFTVTNSTVAATDTVIVSQKSGTDLNQIFITAVAAGSFRISFATTGGTTTEQPVFNFAVIKAVTA